MLKRNIFEIFLKKNWLKYAKGLKSSQKGGDKEINGKDGVTDMMLRIVRVSEITGRKTER